MDANGQRFWMLADRPQWRPGSGVVYDDVRRSLRLASARALPAPPADQTAAQTVARSGLEVTPQAVDALATRALWDSARGLVVSVGDLPGEVLLFRPAAGEQVSDLLLGADGVLYLAVAGRVVLTDLRERWDAVTVGSTSFAAWRLAAHPTGGVWVLDRTNRKLGRVVGLPLPRTAFAPEGSAFRSCAQNPDPPRLVLGPDAPTGVEPVGIAVGPEGRLAVLSWGADATARVHRFTAAGTWDAPVALLTGRFPYSIAWAAPDRVAVLVAGLPEALVFALDEPEPPPVTTASAKVARLLGDRYPLRDHTGGPFLHAPDLPPRYPTTAGQTGLFPLSLPSFVRTGTAENELVMDGGKVRTAWHRLYLEAVFPPHCGATVELAATDDNARPAGGWHPHLFGQAPGAPEAPRAAWVRQPSELAFHPGLLCCPPEEDRAGLFTVLIQRSNTRVRTLTGRYLWVRLTLHGDGRSAPEVAALRAYAPRFSYLNRYLPELYREQVVGTEADATGPSTPADFLERFLDNFEGVLTPLEDRVAAAYRVTDAGTAPDDALPWLGGWIGLAFDPAYPADRRRALLRRTPELYRRRGTATGLRLALDVATGGGVGRGDLVVVEDFRLRRTLATILGADLADETDPLTAGLAVSGNSFVGDTLFLGDEARREFLAVFGPGAADARDEAAVAAFFDELAYRVTVLVHERVHPQDLGLVRRVVERETPAHVLARVVPTTQPFLVGVAALVGVDTYLGPDPAPRTFEVENSRLGRGDVLGHRPGLDPRRESVGPGGPPHADLGPNRVVEYGQSFGLDGGNSSAAAGRRLVRYIWQRID